MNTCRFIFSCLVLVPISSLANSFALGEATVDAVEQAVLHQHVSCEALMSKYLDRIREYDLAYEERAPINALVSINSAVMQEARARDVYLKKMHRPMGALHCVPVVLKDNIDSYDFPTTVGSLSMLGSQPQHDAFIVKQLRDAGAIILAKGTMDEFAASARGVSSRSGRTGNAYNTSQNPGGSSGGVAAAVSAGFAVVGIGTDNSGSVRVPAAFNGLFGLRPSMGMVSRSGIFPRGNIDAIAGPITQNARDAAIVMNVIAKADPQDEVTLKAKRDTDYTYHFKLDALQGKRIGIVRQVADVNLFRDMPDYIDSLFTESFAKLKKAGAEIVDSISLPAFDNYQKDNSSGELEEVNAYLASFPSVRKDYKDICYSKRAPIFGSVKACLTKLRKIARKNSPLYYASLARIEKNRNYVEAIMRENKLDALVYPVSVTGSATYDLRKVNTWYALVASNAGMPALVIRAGYTKEGMPVALQMLGKRFEDGKLLGMAYAYEMQVGARKPPQITKISDDSPVRKMTIEQFNNLLTELGFVAFKKVLALKDEKALTDPEAFQKIAKYVIENTSTS